MILPYTVKDVNFKNTKSRSRKYLNKQCGIFTFLILIFGTICLVIYNSQYLPSNITHISVLKHNNNSNNNHLNNIDSNNNNSNNNNMQSIKQKGKLLNEINTLITTHQLIVFSKSYCPYSKKAKEILNSFQYKVPYHILEVDQRDDASEIKQILGEKTKRYTFPNIFVNGISIGGASEIEIMNESGDLKQLFIAQDIIV
ncbi:unnamed protein product [Cunninghamella blakesleeana]